MNLQLFPVQASHTWSSENTAKFWLFFFFFLVKTNKVCSYREEFPEMQPVAQKPARNLPAELSCPPHSANSPAPARVPVFPECKTHLKSHSRPKLGLEGHLCSFRTVKSWLHLHQLSYFLQLGHSPWRQAMPDSSISVGGEIYTIFLEASGNCWFYDTKVNVAHVIFFFFLVFRFIMHWYQSEEADPVHHPQPTHASKCESKGFSISV